MTDTGLLLPVDSDSTASQLARLVVLISGSGSNLQAIIDACQGDRLPARVVLVISNRRDAYGLIRAREAGILTRYHPLRPYLLDGRGRRCYDADLAAMISEARPDWVVLAGWMHVLSMDFLKHFPNRVVNLHPALPGQFPGVEGIARAYQAYGAGQITHTGVMVHLVPDEGVDEGPVIMNKTIPIYPEDTLKRLEERVHRTEHSVLVEALRRLITRSDGDSSR